VHARLKERRDKVAAFRWLVTEKGSTRSFIGICGTSFGATLGLMRLNELDDITFVIANSSYHFLSQVA